MALADGNLMDTADDLSCVAGDQGQNSRSWSDLPANVVLLLAQCCAQPDAQTLRLQCRAWHALITAAIRTLRVPASNCARAQAYPVLSRLVLTKAAQDEQTQHDAGQPDSANEAAGYASPMVLDSASSITAMAGEHSAAALSLQEVLRLNLPHVTALELSPADFLANEQLGSRTSALQQLRALSLSHLTERDSLPDWTSGVANITQLTLSFTNLNSSNSIQELVSHAPWRRIALQQLPGLCSRLSIVALHKVELDVHMLTQLTSLEMIDCKLCRLLQLDSMLLQELTLQDTDAESDTFEQLQHMPSLTQLALTHTKGGRGDPYQILPEQYIAGVTALRSLSLAGARWLVDWDFLRPLQQLTMLDVSRIANPLATNRVGCVPGHILACLTQLEVLRMAGVVEDGVLIMPGEISRLQQLRLLDLGGSAIRLLPAALNVPQLQEVVLDAVFNKEGADVLRRRGVKVRHVPLNPDWAWHVTPDAGTGYDAQFGWLGDGGSWGGHGSDGDGSDDSNY